MANSTAQQLLFRGIYEFEDPSGTLVASKVPASGTVDLYDGTVLIVRPAQMAILVYKGQITDVFPPGQHNLQTENIPVLSRLANWKLGFESPLRAELYFFSMQVFLARKWGTAQPIIVNLPKLGTIPIRGHGNFSLKLDNPRKFLTSVVAQSPAYEISQLDEFIQGHLISSFAQVLERVTSLDDFNSSREDIADAVERNVDSRLSNYGLSIQSIEVLSLLPSQEIVDAMDARAAISVIGSQKDYMLYKAAKSLDEKGAPTSASDPMHMMMGVMLGKSLVASDETNSAPVTSMKVATKTCAHCQHSMDASFKFCSTCGAAL